MSWLLAAAAALGVLLIPPGELSADALQTAWLVSPGRFFVTRPDGTVETNPELVRLDNPRETFQPKKQPGVKRVFCVGGSTTRGWPFHRRLSYPQLLQQALGPGYEVINAGFMRSDSWSDLALLRELLRYEPDLVLLYEGRNERWDYPLQTGWRARLLRLHVAMQRRSRLYAAAASSRREGSNLGEGVRRWAAQGRRIEDAPLRAALLQNLEKARAMTKDGGAELRVLTQVTYGEGDEEVRRLNGWLRESGLPLIDVDAGFERSGASLVLPPPAVHPDVNGYVLMAAAVASALGGKRVPPVPVLEPDYRKEVYCRVARLYEAVGRPEIAPRYHAKAGPGPCPQL